MWAVWYEWMVCLYSIEGDECVCAMCGWPESDGKLQMKLISKWWPLLIYAWHMSIPSVYFRFSGPSIPAWVIRSPMLFSRSSIRFPMSSIRVMIWSDIDWNLSCTFCNRFWTWFKDSNNKNVFEGTFTKYSHKASTPAYFSDQHCCSGNSSVRHRCQPVQASHQTWWNSM